MDLPTDIDEKAIRDVVARWLDASRRGDVDAVMRLMTDDALFFVAGQPPMTRAAFEAATRAQSGTWSAFEARSDVGEVLVSGDLATLWSHLSITVRPGATAGPVTRAGHTLTVFRRVDGEWKLARDANLLVKV